MQKPIQIILTTLSFLLFWQAITYFFHLPAYILPTPYEVITSLITNFSIILNETKITALETLLGLFLGTLIACFTAIIMSLYKPVKFWILPLLLISQALPTFAIAPLLVMWFGFGMASKIITTIIMLFFPITTALHDGLTRTPHVLLDISKTMRATKWKTLWHIQFPAALPSLASGLRVAAAIAPIGAIVGEWVGASHGLGYLMLNANARMQIDLMFAALFCIIVFSLLLYFVIDLILRKLIFWKPLLS